MISRIDHVSLAVRDFDAAFHFFAEILGAVPGASGDDPGMQYSWEIMSLGDLSRIELITPTGQGSFLDGFLKDRHGGVHHITLQVPDIRAAKDAVERHGIPTFGFHEYGPVWKEFFIHPKHAFGVLVQMAEFTSDDWLSPSVRMPRHTRLLVERSQDGLTLKFAHPGGGTVRVGLSRDEARKLMDDLKDALA
jgi:methylmalonyl-CoA/ethylmalonyl-CoA epimerase